MSLFNSIAAAVVGKGVSSLFDRKKKKTTIPKLVIPKTKFSKNLKSRRVDAPQVCASPQTDRLLARHQSIMSSFNVGKTDIV